MTRTRRDFLRTVGLATAGVSAVGGTASAVSDLYETTPEYVTLSYDESLLKRYQPSLYTSHLNIKPAATYGVVAESTENDTIALCYWHYYETQVSPIPSTSHRYDREPVYVFINQSSGDVELVSYSAYHWLSYKTPDVTGVSDSDGYHPTLRPNKPYHHHVMSTHTLGDGVHPPLKDGIEALSAWYKTDLRGELEPTTATNPWRMKFRDSWWYRGTADFSFAETVYNTSLGISTALGVDIWGSNGTDLR